MVKSSQAGENFGGTEMRYPLLRARQPGNFFGVNEKPERGGGALMEYVPDICLTGLGQPLQLVLV
jgi:hypothetical protein